MRIKQDVQTESHSSLFHVIVSYVRERWNWIAARYGVYVGFVDRWIYDVAKFLELDASAPWRRG